MNLDIRFQRGVPLRRQLELALRDAIRSGRLTAGSELPPSRDLAEQLGVSRSVVVDSYAQLVAEGYLSARQGSRTRVARLPAPLAPPPPRILDERPRFRFDLRPGQIDVHAFPRARWQACLLQAVRTLPDTRLVYGPPRGAPELRNAVAEHLRRMRGVAAESDDVLVCCAASHGLSLIWRTLAREGAIRVAIEDPSWRWQRYTVEEAGLDAVPIRVDEDGLVVEDLAAADVDAVVLTPAHQFPTGAVLSPERRHELVEWAQARGGLIVEDDYDVEYRYDREPISAVQGLAPDHVAFVGTTSKTLAPALRIGWVVPPKRLLDDLGTELRATGVTPATIDQVALASFIADSDLERHIRRVRKHYAEKRSVLVEALARELPEARIGGVAAGLHLIAWLPSDIDEHRAAERARELGVGLHELHYHCTTVFPRPPAFVLGYSYLSANELQDGSRLLAQAVEETRSAPRDRRAERRSKMVSADDR